MMIASTFFGQLLHPLGTCTGTAGQITGCRGYNFWSGIGSDISEITLVIALVMLIMHHTCHVGFCFRPGRHPVDGTGYKTCKKHHPDLHSGRTTAQHITDAFHAAREPKRGANGRFISRRRGYFGDQGTPTQDSESPAEGSQREAGEPQPSGSGGS